MTLNRWKISSPNAIAVARPTAVVSSMARMVWIDRTAIHSIETMAIRAIPPIRKARSARVANSSSSSGTGPVSRTLTPLASVRPRACTARRMSWEASEPGSSLAKSSRGSTRITLRSWCGSIFPALTRLCQEKKAGLPDSICSSASARREAGDCRSCTEAWPAASPVAKVDRVLISPRRLGSDASGPRNGWALISLAMLAFTSAVDRNSRPLWRQKGVASGRWIELNSGPSLPSRSASAAADSSASSGVLPSITTTIWPWAGKRASNAACRWRQSSVCDNSWSVSVVMAK